MSTLAAMNTLKLRDLIAATLASTNEKVIDLDHAALRACAATCASPAAEVIVIPASAPHFGGGQRQASSSSPPIGSGDSVSCRTADAAL